MLSAFLDIDKYVYITVNPHLGKNTHYLRIFVSKKQSRLLDFRLCFFDNFLTTFCAFFSRFLTYFLFNAKLQSSEKRKRKNPKIKQ